MNTPYFTSTWFADYRNRAYNVASEFSHMQFKDSRYTVVQVPVDFDEVELFNSIGKVMVDHNGKPMDKWTKQNRVDYVRAHLDDIRRHVKHPATTVSEWFDHKDPKGYMSEASRLIASVDHGALNGTMCGSDATCSGIQVAAGLTRSFAMGQIVNLTDTEEYYDAYIDVIEFAKAAFGNKATIDKLKGSEASKKKALDIMQNQLSRAFGKVGLMKLIYGASLPTIMDDVQDLLVDSGICEAIEWVDGKAVDTTTFEVANIVGNLIFKAGEHVGKEAVTLLNWITSVAEAVHTHGTHLSWTDTNGNRIHNKIMKTENFKRNIMVGERGSMTVVRINDKVISGTYDYKKMIAAAAVNYIHSYDANIMANVVAEAANRNIEIMTIHDQFKTTSNHMAELDSIIREEFTSIFKQDNLVRLVEDNRSVIGDEAAAELLATMPMKDTLNVGDIHNNMYGFS